jgi:hypothetical protein
MYAATETAGNIRSGCFLSCPCVQGLCERQDYTERYKFLRIVERQSAKSGAERRTPKPLRGSSNRAAGAVECGGLPPP